MALKDREDRKRPKKAPEPRREASFWLPVIVAAGAAGLLLATSLIPYDRVLPQAERDYDVVAQMETDGNVASVDDVINVYHLDENVRPNLTVDGQQIHFRQHREPAQP